MLYIKDIIEAIDKIDEFVGDMEFNEFLGSLRERNLQGFSPEMNFTFPISSEQ